MIKVVLFDFDGTIAKTMELVFDIVNSLSDEFGYKKLKEEDIGTFRKLGMRDSLGKLGISMFKLPIFARRIKARLNEQICSAGLVGGMKGALVKLKRKGYRLAIVTSNSKENVEKFLKKNGLGLFDFVYSDSSIFGKHAVIKNLLKRQKLKPEEVVYIGDETRDVEAANKCGIKIISVTWGFNSKHILEKFESDSVVENPAELAGAVEKLSEAR